MIEQQNFWSLGRIFRTMPERFLRVPRRALHFAIGDILLFYNRINPSKGGKINFTEPIENFKYALLRYVFEYFVPD